MATAIQGLSKANRKAEDSDGVGLARDSSLGSVNKQVEVRREMPSSLSSIVHRIASLLPHVDTTAPYGKKNQRTGAPYLPGLPALGETDARDLLVEAWVRSYPAEFEPSGHVATEVDYPGLAHARCDLLFSTSGWTDKTPEWAIELKRIQFVGDNGKNNDFNVQKMLSPYLKDRSLIHDIERMRAYPLARRHAVIGYAFSYSLKSCSVALSLHPKEASRIDNIREVCRRNDPASGEMPSTDLIHLADLFFKSRGVVKNFAMVSFTGLWRHPCGGDGNVFGWEVG
jgi:hypothetical protein